MDTEAGALPDRHLFHHFFYSLLQLRMPTKKRSVYLQEMLSGELPALHARFAAIVIA